jgi:required for meiotic nuclear division protein 1
VSNRINDFLEMSLERIPWQGIASVIFWTGGMWHTSSRHHTEDEPFDSPFAFLNRKEEIKLIGEFTCKYSPDSLFLDNTSTSNETHMHRESRVSHSEPLIMMKRILSSTSLTRSLPSPSSCLSFSSFSFYHNPSSTTSRRFYLSCSSTPSQPSFFVAIPTSFVSPTRLFSSIPSPQVKPTPRKKTKTIRQVEIEHGNNSLGHYSDEESKDSLQPDDQILVTGDFKKVRGVCTAESYDLPNLYQHLLTTYPNCQLFSDEVIRFTPNGKECFIFDMGALVAWDLTSTEFDLLQQQLTSFEVNSISNPKEKEFDEIDFTFHETQDFSMLHDKHEPIILIGKNQSVTNIYLDQLAYSHGIANSVKLAVLENQLDHFVDSIKHLPIVLKNGQKINLTRTQSLSRLGELLQFRAVLNLHSGLIETPDLYWNYSKLEAHFRSISNEFDIKQRVDALNKKLDYANDIAELLKGYLSERHSLDLEWAIIILIAVEVGFELLHFAERYVA